MSLLTKLMFPPKCIGCRELYDVFDEPCDVALCAKCMEHWEAAKATECRECGVAMSLCRCIPDNMKQSGVCAYVKAVPYDSDKPDSVPDKLIFFMKHKHDKRASYFAAEQLCDVTVRAIIDSGANLENSVITYVPRRRSAVAEDGFDQAELLAKNISGMINVPCERVIERKSDGKAQKKLNAEDRRKNVQTAFGLADGADVLGKAVVIVDDVVTTGESLSQCAEIVTNAGADKVICVSLGKTNRKNHTPR